METLGYREGDFPVAEEFGAETLSLPFYPIVPAEFLDFFVEALISFLPAALPVPANVRAGLFKA